MSATVNRYLAALPRGNNEVFLSWRLLKNDKVDAGFRVERRNGAGWETVTPEEVAGSTSMLDTTPKAAEYRYRVVDPDGGISESISIDSGREASLILQETPLAAPAEDMHHALAPGDLLNNGKTGYVVMVKAEGQMHLDAYGPDGAHLWRRPLGLSADIQMGHGTPPYLAWDVNHDGRTEVVTMTARGCWDKEIKAARNSSTAPDHGDPEAEVRTGTMLTVMDGETGETVWEVPWPGTTMHAHMNAAYTRGQDRCPALVIHDGRPYTGSRLHALDGKDGKILWQVTQPRPTGHNMDTADIDEDGVQEIISGGTCYNGDGTVRWEAEMFGHTDISKPAKIVPERDGLQIWYAVETGTMNPGVYLVDKDGNTIFKEPFRHAHYGWVACHAEDTPGLQPHTAEDVRAGDMPWFKGEDVKKERDRLSAQWRKEAHFPVFLPDGSHWMTLTDDQRKSFVPVQWDEGRAVSFIIRKDNKRIVKLNRDNSQTEVSGSSLPEGGNYGRNLLCLDVAGDFRENIVAINREKNSLMVLMNPNPASERRLSPMEDFRYRHDRSQNGSGYYIYLSPPYTW